MCVGGSGGCEMERERERVDLREDGRIEDFQ